MKIERVAGLIVFAGVALTGPRLAAQGPSASGCAGATNCMETRDIVARITDFRSSMGARHTHLESTTIRFTNKSARPIILGYVSGSGVATDDQGNRFTTYNQTVRGIGIISGSNVDTKFSLQPGESADTRFDLGWSPSGGQIFGTSWSLELTVREIDQVAATQYRLGQEIALRFDGLRGGGQVGATGGQLSTVTTATPTASPAQAVAGAAVQTAQGAATNVCMGVARCYDAGAFSATIVAMTPSIVGGRHREMDITIRFRNNTTQPVVLAYAATSSSMIDNLGNRYLWGRGSDRSVSGMGISWDGKVDPQFALRPGESRDAKFTVYRFDSAKLTAGTSFTYDVSLDQVQVLSTEQIRPLRQYALHFDNLQAGGAANIGDAVNKLKSLFKIGH